MRSENRATTDADINELACNLVNDVIDSLNATEKMLDNLRLLRLKIVGNAVISPTARSLMDVELGLLSSLHDCLVARLRCLSEDFK